jgi:membrane protein DedA with SNARE-associated domain
MMDWILSQPFWLAFLFLTCVVCLRSQATYWLGRGIRAGIVKTSWSEKLASEKATAGREKLERYGWPIIPLSFLTVGFQTAVNLSAGLIGWRWPRYTLAASFGWVLWGAIYAAGGLAVFVGIGKLIEQSPWLAALVVVGVVLGFFIVFKLVKRRKAAKASTQGEPDSAETIPSVMTE